MGIKKTKDLLDLDLDDLVETVSFFLCIDVSQINISVHTLLLHVNDDIRMFYLRTLIPRPFLYSINLMIYATSSMIFFPSCFLITHAHMVQSKKDHTRTHITDTNTHFTSHCIPIMDVCVCVYVRV